METLRLRVRAPKGALTLTVAASATLADLQSNLLASTEIAPEEQDIRTGFPPKPLPQNVDASSSLSSLGIRSGDTLVVSQRQGTAPPTPTPPSPAAAKKATKAPGPARNERPAPKPAFDRDAISTASIPVDGGYIALRVVPDDNQCLFHAAGMLLEPGSPNAATVMRQAVAKAVKGNPIDFSEVVLGKAPEAYAKQIVDPRSWGGAIELAALSASYDVEIASVDVQTGRTDRYGEGQHPNVIILIYSGIHYDAVTLSPMKPEASTWPYDLGFDVITFDKDAIDMPLAATTELATKLRQARYFTDTASFSLRCEVCAQGLTGEKEAREHVKATGHASFSEYS